MPAKRERAQSLTELEGGVLGLVWSEGPCTAYAIRQHFLESRAPRWSGSAGAIYPLVRRLEARRLLSSEPATRGKRAQRDFRITPVGKRALKAWLQAPIHQGEGTLIHDPLRTRVLFLRALPRNAAITFLAQAHKELRETLRQTEADDRAMSDSEDVFAGLAARNALLVTRARLRWLGEVRAALGASSPTADHA